MCCRTDQRVDVIDAVKKAVFTHRRKVQSPDPVVCPNMVDLTAHRAGDGIVQIRLV